MEILMIRVAIVGVGLASARHIESAAALHDRMIISACVDRDIERARQVASSCGAAAYATLEEALPFCDVVALCTPPAYRLRYAVAAMEAGKAILLEKPLCMTLEDGRAIVECAKRTGMLAVMGFNNRFRKGFTRLRDDIVSGKLGKLQSFYIHRQGMGLVKEGAASWRSGMGQVCGHAIESLSHDLDVLRFCAGEVRAVKAFTLDTLPYAPGYDNNAVVAMELANGALANIYSCWSSPLAFNTRGAIGSEGATSLFGPKLWNLTEYRMKRTDMEEETVEVLNDFLGADCYIAEWENFLDALKGRCPSATTALDGYRVLQISHAILESAATGNTVYLEQ